MCSDKKHAYLIMAHNNFSILKTLIKLLDDSRNDIFIHIDKKVEKFDFDVYKSLCQYSPVYFSTRRIDVRWGRNSQIEAEMHLFSEAHSHRHYDYYHLISGVDLPLKTQDEIHAFFSEYSVSFIYYSKEITRNEYERVSLLYHIPIESRLVRKAETPFHSLQRAIGINLFKKWEKKGYTVEKGPNWVSLTNEAVEALLSEQDIIKKMTRFSHCADEEYKQIILKKANVPIYRDKNGETSSLRFVDRKSVV